MDGCFFPVISDDFQDIFRIVFRIRFGNTESHSGLHCQINTDSVIFLIGCGRLDVYKRQIFKSSCKTRISRIEFIILELSINNKLNNEHEVKKSERGKRGYRMRKTRSDCRVGTFEKKKDVYKRQRIYRPVLNCFVTC